MIAMLERGHNVLLLAHSQFRGMFIGLARKLRQERGVAVQLYTATQQEKQYYERIAPDAFDSINLFRTLYGEIGQPVLDLHSLYKKAAAYEKRFGISLNSIVLNDRHLGRGFALGGYRHPRSRFSEKADYPQVIRAVVHQIDFWLQEIDLHKPRLLLNCGKTAAVIARAYGIPFRTVMGARYKNFQYWSHDEYGALPRLAEVFKSMTVEHETNIVKPYSMHMEMRSRYLKQYAVTSVAKDTLLTTARHAYRHMRRYEKSKGYYLGEELSYIVRKFIDHRKIRRTHVLNLDDIEGQKFIYFPLHMEPEIALQGLSPEYFCQLSCIASLARDIPANTILAVKENLAALGRRPRDFYGQISEFKNVVFLNPAQMGLEVAKRADATATITGTGGFEAAVCGNPVLSFGRNNLYNMLSHVYCIEKEDEIGDCITKALSHHDKNKAIDDGNKFLNSIIKLSFDIEDFKMTAPDKISDAATNNSYHSLVKSLEI